MAGVFAALVAGAALAGDPEAFVSGAVKDCTECNLAWRDLQERNFQRTKLDRAILKGANLEKASLFRATLLRADLSGAKLSGANLNAIDAKWSNFSGADLTEALMFEADLSSADLTGANLKSARLGRARLNQAVLEGANYIGVGPTFPSGTKQFSQFMGTELLRSVQAEIRLPAFAIGGITWKNLPEVLATGFTRIAVSGAITAADDPASAARELMAALKARGDR